jgi:outer membrane lipoprotein-sorting protein
MRVLIVATAAVVALVACGGTASPSAQAPAATSAAGGSVATSTTSSSTAAPAASAGPSIADAIKAGRLSTYKVTYRWMITSGGQTVTSEQTWYAKAPNARFDLSLGGGAGTFSVFSLADGTYVCTNAGGAASCQKSAAGAALQSNPAADFGLQLRDHPDQFNSTYQGTKTIAGQQAQCYNVKGIATTTFGDVTSCYSSSGIPLLTQMTAQGSTFSMEATAFSTDVTDTDFKLPAAVR